MAHYTTRDFAGVFGTPETKEKLEIEREEKTENRKRRQWFNDRLWHNGPHANCCKKCLQAGYIMALIRAGRQDLLGEYPELIAVYEELSRDGMLQTVAER